MIQAEEILRFLDSEQYLYEWNGDLAFRIDGFCSLNHVKSGCITWAKNETRLDEIPEKLSENILIVGPQDIGTTGRKRKHIQNVLSCKEPKKIFFNFTAFFSRAKGTGNLRRFRYTDQMHRRQGFHRTWVLYWKRCGDCF